MEAWLIGIIVLIVVQIIPRILQSFFGPRQPPISEEREGQEGEINMAGGSITEITSVNQFEGIMKGMQNGQLMVIDFNATWCGPCKFISPIVEKMSQQYNWVKFVSIDVDRQRMLAQRYRITAMPTFKFIKDQKEIAELRGASPSQLQALVNQHAGKAAQFAAPASGSGSTIGKPDSQSLASFIAPSGVTCLNESSAHPFSSIFGSKSGPKGSSWLESDVDPELLLSIPFNEPVKIKAISLFSGVSPSQAPKTVKIYVNQPNLDFNDAESQQPAQEMDLRPEHVKGDKMDVRFVRFRNVRHLSILIKDNQEGEETTRLDSLDIFGAPVGQATSSAQLPKGEHEH